MKSIHAICSWQKKKSHYYSHCVIINATKTNTILILLYVWPLFFPIRQPCGWRTGFQVELTEVLRGAEGDNHHTVPEDVLPAGHLESELCAGDETVLLDHRVDGLHPAVSEVHPGWGEREKGATGWEVRMSGGAGGKKSCGIKLFQSVLVGCSPCYGCFNPGYSKNTEFQRKTNQHVLTSLAGSGAFCLGQSSASFYFSHTHQLTSSLHTTIESPLRTSFRPESFWTSSRSKKSKVNPFCFAGTIKNLHQFIR